MMYSGSGTQVCNMPLPACYGLPFPGPYPPIYPGTAPNMPVPFPQFNGQYTYPPTMPYYPNYSMLPPNVPPTNHFSSIPPQYPPPSSNQKNGREQSHPYQHNLLPPNASSTNHFSSMPPQYPPLRSNQKVNRDRSHPYQQKNRNFRQEKTPAFHCESCDKDFYSSTKYEQHVSQHVTCGLEGCTFKAHAIIVEKHIAMQHRNNLFNRIVKGNTPEEIEKWILERKKHYPTQGKIVEKRIQKVEMEKRGERYNDRRKSSLNQRNNPKDLRNHQKLPYGNRNPVKNTTKFGSKVVHTNQEPKNNIPKSAPKRNESSRTIRTIDDGYEYQRSLPPFRGTAYYLSSQASDDDLEDSGLDSVANKIIDSVCSEKIVITPEPCKVRSSLDLIRGYDSSEDSDNCDELSVTSKLEISSVIEEKEDDDDDDDSGPEECSFKLPVPSFILGDLVEPTVSSEKKNVEKNLTEASHSQSSHPDETVLNVVESNENSKKLVRKRRRNRSGKSDDDQVVEKKNDGIENKSNITRVTLPRKRFRPPTLLEKLLAPEIKHERNVILQCVRYIVNQNYFECF